MITLIASIAGFVTSIFPEIIKAWRDQINKKHELAILDRQIEYNRLAKSLHLQEISALAEFSEQRALYATFRSGVGWVDALNGCVRPVLAYSFFALYVVIKYMQFASFNTGELPVSMYLNVLWNINDQAIFASIISFYFGQKTFNRLKGRGK